MDKQKQLKRIYALHKLFQEGKIPTLSQHEVHPKLPSSSRENYLYFTLPVSINFQRSSPAMWVSALKTYEDPKTNYLYYPEETAKRSREEIQRDLVKHRLALQPNRHTDIWIAISRTLNEYYDNDPRRVLSESNLDAGKIIQTIQTEKKKLFPYLSGAKMTNYWLYILSHYTDVELKNKQEISIIPDTHVLQCTVQLGLSDKILTPVATAAIWKELLEGAELSPIDMHPVLWNWSRNNFLPEV